MPKSRANPSPTTPRRAKRMRHSAPCVETQARTILAAMVEEAVQENSGLKLPDVSGTEPAAGNGSAVAFEPGSELEAAAGQGIDELRTQDLVAIAKDGASLELDGSRFSSEELTLLAENVSDQAHLKIANSGNFTREELSTIALSAPGQVIFA